MINIENQHLKIGVKAKGAELQSIYHKGHQQEYMWNGDPGIWGKHSPLLFPIVGTLKGGTFYYEGEGFSMGRHGFAREMDFELEEHGKDFMRWVLRSNAETRAVYPFDFELRVIYRLAPNGLATTYEVRNVSPRDIYFSIGGHPAFKVPLTEGSTYNDYYLQFEEKETASRWPISKDGLIEKDSSLLLNDTDRLDLTKPLFYNDALVLKGLKSTTVTLKSDKSPRGLEFDFADFPFLGIWGAKDADFVCIEPWCGIADSVDSDQQLIRKEGIEHLGPKEIFERTWTLAVF